MTSDVFNKLVDNAVKDNLSHKVVKDVMSIIRNIMKFTQRKYKLTDISYLDDIVIPKKATTREDVKAKRENYLEIDEVKAIVKNYSKKPTRSS